MQNINHQIQRIAERYKIHENNNELKEDLQHLLNQLKEQETISSVKPSEIGKLASDRLLQLVDINVSEKQIIKTGFSDYDTEFGGLMKGELLVLGGRPGMGKTQLMVNLCSTIALTGKACGYLTLELSSFQLTNRFIGYFAQLEQCYLLKGNIEKINRRDLEEGVRTLSTLPIFIYDQFVTSISSVSEKCRQLVMENNVEVIFIDYLQLMGTFNRRINRETEIAIVMRELKNLAKELNIVLVVASQLSRQVENRPGGAKRPHLSDLRESGSIEQDADKVLFIYRHEYYGIEFDEDNESTRNVMELIIAKNNTGYCETIKLTVKRGFTGFTDYKGPYSEIQISDDRLNELK
jgi:replicative DNA helicase